MVLTKFFSAIFFRDNSNVTKPEWQSLLNLNKSDEEREDCDDISSEVVFHRLVLRSARKLMEQMSKFLSSTFLTVLLLLLICVE